MYPDCTYNINMIKRKNFSSFQVIFGEEREQTGNLLSIDHSEGVVKLDHADVKMLQLRYLCKMK